MSRLESAYARATKRFESNEIGTGIRADDSIWNHSEQRSDGRRIRCTVPPEFAGVKRAITRYDWAQSLDLSRKLTARVGELAGAIRQKNTYAIGDAWCPKFHGKNQDYGNVAAEWLEYWFEVANVRGEPFDFITSLFVDAVGIDRDGDSAMLSVSENGEPRVQFIPAHRIAFRNSVGQDISGIGIVPDGRFKGAKCYNGVIFANNGKVIGYNILGEKKEDDRQFSTAECQLLYEPEWHDMGRGVPAMATSLLTWMDYEDIVHFIKRQVKQDSAQGILHYNEDGSAPSPSGADWMKSKDTGAANQDVLIEQLEGNEMMYIKALGGGKIEPYRSDRPHPNTDAHNMRLLRGCFLSMGWFYELYDPSAVGGASTRLIQDGARASVNRRQRTVWKRFKRAIAHALSMAMDNGDIPRNDDADWMAWDATMPAKLTVDARYDDKTKMEKIRMCAGTYSEIYGDDGKGWKEFIRQRITEQAFIESECKTQGVDVDKVQLLTPNGPPAEQSNESTGDKTDKEKENE
jgi:hypothetical protein